VTERSWHCAPPSIRAWDALVREVRRSTARRIVISSEAFSDGDEAAVRRVVDAFGPERVHIVVTLRPLARILPSQSGQAVAGGLSSTYEGWLRHSFANPTGEENQFWHRHRHDRLVERWASVVGPGNLTVVVVDDRDHSLVLRAFEQLVGLRDGTLRQEDRVANRSMTLPEVEAVRAFNIAFKAEALPMALHADVMRVGAARMIKQTVPSEAGRGSRRRSGRSTWPPRSSARWSTTSRLRRPRDGRPERLAEAPVSGFDGSAGEVHIPPEVAGSLAMSVLHAMGVPRRTDRLGMADDPRLAGVSARRLARALVLRTRRAALARWPDSPAAATPTRSARPPDRAADRRASGHATPVPGRAPPAAVVRMWG
jgi:hypothetical protein